MKKYICITMMIVLALMTATACGQNVNVYKEKFTPQQLVSHFFLYWQEKNITKLNSLLVPEKQDIDWETDKLQYVTLLSASEDTEKSSENAKLFLIKYEIKFRGDSSMRIPNGIHTESMTVLRKDKAAKWLIADWSEG